MSLADSGEYRGAVAETRLVLGYARSVWQLIPRGPRLAFAGAAVLMTGVSGCGIAIPLLLGRLVDLARPPDEDATGPKPFAAALIVLGWIASIYIIRELLQLVRRFLIEASCTRLEHHMTVKVISHVIRADLAALSEEKIGALQGRISRTTVAFVRFVRLILLEFLPPLVTGTFAVVAALAKEPLVAGAMVGVVPFSLWLTLRQIASQKGVRLRLMRGREAIDGVVVELLGGLDFIRAANTEKHELDRIARTTEGLRRIEQSHHFKMAAFGAARALIEGAFHILVLGLSVYLATHGRISYGDILTFSILFLNVMAPLNEVHRALDEGHECSLQVADLLAIVSQEPDRSFMPPMVKVPRVEPRTPLIEVHDLRMTFPTLKGLKTALDGVSLFIRHGETIGLAGPSGCGKTTLLRVLLRLSHPTAGEVRVGGVPLTNLSRQDIGRLIGYVGQNPFVFAGSIAENIRYGSPEATPEAIETSARRAHLHDEISAMPGGYHAAVTERGANLSGGQRQRLAIARVLLKDPPVLILDEGTSALDTVGERHVQQAIDLVREDRTVILVAHRLSTLRDVDRILVFKDGRIIEEGTFPDLTKNNGLFADLVRCGEMPPAS